MTKLIGALTFCGLAALISCDNGDSATSGRLSDDDCPIGTFKPEGLSDCVFPADDMFGSPLGVSDNRCVSGQPAFPPVCASDIGGRSYFSATKNCAPNYRFLPGACQRAGSFAGNGGGGTTGFGGFGPAGTIGTGFGGDAAGVTGAAGDNGVGTGSGGDLAGVTGSAGAN